MKRSKIKRAFNRLYNYLPNPIFKYPRNYYKIGNFLVEVAMADTISSLSGGYGKENRLRWTNCNFSYSNLGKYLMVYS